MKPHVRLKIRWQLLQLLLALALPFLLYLALAARWQASEEREHAAQRMLGVARVTAARLDDHIGDIRQLLSVLSAVVDPEAEDASRNDLLLRAMQDHLPPQINNLSVWTIAGENIGSMDPRLRAKHLNVAPRKFFHDAVARDALAIEAPAVAAVNGALIGLFALPVRRGGEIVGVVAASARLSHLQDLLSRGDSLAPGSIVTVTDSGGIVLARSLDPTRWIGKLLPPRPDRHDPAGDAAEGLLEERGADGAEHIGGFATASRVPWRVDVDIPTEVALAPVKRRLIESLLAGGLMFCIGLGLAVGIGERIASPLRQLGNDAAALERGDLLHRSRVGPGGEIGQLAATLNRMADALQERTALLEASREQLAQITDSLPALISYLDRDQRFRFANRVYQAWLDREPAGLIGRSLLEVYGEQSYAGFRHHIEAALAGTRVQYERDLKTTGGLRRVEVTVVPRCAANGEVLGLYVLMQDVTANRLVQAERARSEERLNLALEGSGLALFDWNIEQGELYHSAQAAAMRGEAAEEMTTPSSALIHLMHPDDRDAMLASVKAAVTGATERYEAEFRVKTRAGDWIWLRSLGRVVERSSDGRALRLAGTHVDVTKRKADEERLRLLAEVDALTGLPNRALFLDRLELAIVRAARTGKPMALLFLDIDHFKSVNDGYGHHAGDEVLQVFALALQASLRPTDTVARLAGDEFTVVLEDLTSMADAEAVARTLLAAVRRRVGIGEQAVAVSASIGITLHAGGRTDPAALLRLADAALYEAKRLGRDRYALAPESQAAAARPDAVLLRASSG